MRVLLIAAVLGTVAYPAFASVIISCDNVKKRAENEYLFAMSLNKMMQTMPASLDKQNATAKQKDDFLKAMDAERENWKRVQVFANIYSAFCKD